MKKYLLSICMLGLLLGLAIPSNAECNSLEEECLKEETALVKVAPKEKKAVEERKDEGKKVAEEKKVVEDEVALDKEEAEEKEVSEEEFDLPGISFPGVIHACEVGVWSETEGKCVPRIALCSEGEVSINGKCVSLDVGGAILCRKGQVVVNGKCVDAGTAARKINIPSLQHFDLTDSEVDKDYIFLQFAPKGTPHFYLNVQLETVEGRDELAAWCTGDESLCKAVGNGQECGPDLPTGNAAWCYLNEEEKPREPIVGPICENCKKKL